VSVLFGWVLQLSSLIVVVLLRIHIPTFLKSMQLLSHLPPMLTHLQAPFSHSNGRKGKWVVCSKIYLAFFKECVPFSTTSMASSNVWFVHFPFFIIGGTLLTTWHGYLVSNAGYGGTFSLSKATWFITTLHHLQGTMKNMIV
jgi:hypothetical protein